MIIEDEKIQNDSPILYTKGQGADLLGVSERTVSRLIENGELPLIRIGRSIRIERQAVCHFLDEKREYNGQRVELELSQSGESLCNSISETASIMLPANREVESRLEALLKPVTSE